MSKALGIIDVQRGFMPAEEGTNLNELGFGELAVPDGELVVPPANRLLAAFAGHGLLTFTSQDWHPAQTAHFSTHPDFVNNWPVHCVANSPGAELHPGLKVLPDTVAFKKGIDALLKDQKDTSYSAYFSWDKDNRTLPDVLSRRGITEVTLGGLALDYCVGKTAIDLKTRIPHMEVTVAIDATKGITDEASEHMLEDFKNFGIQTKSTDQIIAELEA